MAKPYTGTIVLMFVLGLLATPLSLMKPFSLSFLIDSGFGNRPVPQFIRFFFPAGHLIVFSDIVLVAAGMVILIALLENLYNIITSVAGTYTSEKLVLRFRTLLFEHVQRLSLTYHDANGSADALYRIQYDIVKFKTFILDNFVSLFQSVVTLLIMLGVLFYINWPFALIAICTMLPLLVLTPLSQRLLKKEWRQIREKESQALSVIHEALSMLRVVKAFGRETHETNRFSQKGNTALRAQVKATTKNSIYTLAVGMIIACGTSFFIYYGANEVRNGHMTLGELTLVIAYLSQVLGPLYSISKHFNALQASWVSIERVFDLLDHKPEVKELPDARACERTRGAFTFESVSFTYPTGKPILENISFEAKPGDRVGIKGTTGSGKSTLIQLLFRFYDPQAGTIRMDGMDIRTYRLEDYRKQFSLVMQEPVLFSATIEENILYGRPGATHEEVVEAARAANAHEFIMRKPEGYQTKVGERGMQLSGGERQRIAIARAFIKNAPVLILDEPTSSVDIKTEGLIMEAMNRLMEGKTTFLITHRMEPLEVCNVVLHMENGIIQTSHYKRKMPESIGQLI
jgi:ATP-binding cassette subfamily B protein